MAKNTTPAAPATSVSFPLCGCGCGVPTVTAKATFLSGHDARHAGALGRALVANPADEAALTRLASLTPALQAKVARFIETANRKEAEKAAKAAARDAAKAAAKAAYDAHLAAI
jgi:hypothetical protein